ncbi:MAG: SDR family NAD(P)-dependent oxidoreductase [Aquiluna sp.]|nr:SDR family NAD(P)-dependent oxidoreductase [Aquiluna sp.]
MKREFEGLVAIVTGSGSGIGLATAKLLTERGAKVFGFDLEEGDLGDFGHWISCDVGDSSHVARAFFAMSGATDRLDIVVNNAGIGATGTIEQATLEEWENVFRVNVFGTAHVSTAALPWLRRSPNASIVNLCSIAATVGLQSRAIYSASKGAVHSLTLAMAADHVGENIRINAVSPGTADTPWVQRLLEKADDPEAERISLESRQPIGRLISADEVARAVCFLASPLQASTTGSSLAVDGGMDKLNLRR